MPDVVMAFNNELEHRQMASSNGYGHGGYVLSTTT
jgi:hypothetical protein